MTFDEVSNYFARALFRVTFFLRRHSIHCKSEIDFLVDRDNSTSIVVPVISYFFLTKHPLHYQTMSNQMYANGALAAAVAAAAELAQSGGDLYNHNTTNQFPMMTPSKTASLDDSSDGEGQQEDAERRITKSRERNREHARKTRLRKKAQLELLQGKVRGLQGESKVLKQSLEECSLASILVGLSSGGQDRLIQTLLKESSKAEDIKTILPATAVVKRKRWVPDDVSEKQAQPLRIKIGGHTQLIGGGRTHINWKTGVYSDDNGVQKKLTHKQLESLRYVLHTVIKSAL